MSDDGADPPDGPDPPEDVLVQAHRGLSAEKPENTMAAFEAAVEAGFQGIELDVRLTHDGEVVVLHDADLSRTTDGTGRVGDLDYSELRGFDTGAGPVPRLDDVLGSLADWQGMWNIEIKARRATAPTLDLLAHHGVAGRAHVTAMDPAVLALAAEHAPDVPRGLITLGPPDDMDLQEAVDRGCAWLNVDHGFLDRNLVAKAEELGLKVGAWTVNDADDAMDLVVMGVAAIITDSRDVLDALG